MRILLPIDGSYNADVALETVLNEPWSEETVTCVMTVAELDCCSSTFQRRLLG